jgi:hypothetical protein
MRTGASDLPCASFAAWTNKRAGKTNAISVQVEDPVSAKAKSYTYISTDMVLSADTRALH